LKETAIEDDCEKNSIDSKDEMIVPKKLIN